MTASCEELLVNYRERGKVIVQVDAPASGIPGRRFPTNDGAAMYPFLPIPRPHVGPRAFLHANYLGVGFSPWGIRPGIVKDGISPIRSWSKHCVNCN